MDLRIYNERDRASALYFLKRELFRLATFPDNWCHESNPNLTKEKMASAGFFYTGLIDRVQCAFCKVYIDRWCPEDTPIIEHKRHTINACEDQFIFCPLMANFPTGNVPRDITGREITWNSDIMRFRALMDKMPNYAARDNLIEGLIFIRDVTLADIINTQSAKKPSMKMQTRREETFINWPVSLQQSVNIKAMAHAGFYHTGKIELISIHLSFFFLITHFTLLGFEDEVQCYHCKCRIMDWDANKDPWVEHIEKNHKCFHVRLVKGSAFIKKVQRKIFDRKLCETIFKEVLDEIEKDEPKTPKDNDDDDDEDNNGKINDDNNEGLVIF